MAWLDCIQHEFQEATLDECGRLVWTKSPDKKPVERLPQIFWADHSPWDEANAWSTERTASSAVDAETVRREMKHLYRYANWLESKGLDWRHFPVRQAEQVLRIFRKHLVDERKAGRLRGSTVSNCMNAVIRFYRFANLHNLVGNTVPMWHDRHIAIPIADSCGFRRAVLRMSSDLSIPYRRVVGDQLEDGLLPLLSEDMNRLLRYTAEHETEELHLMLCHGFFTGARVGTNVTLTVTGLEIAREDPFMPGVFLLAVGPGTGIATKGSVSGNLWVPKVVLDDLKRYATSTKRLMRETRALPKHKNLLFLTRSGRPYTVATVDRLVLDMRARAVMAEMRFMEQFKFHQSRATFGTWFLDILLKSGASTTEAVGVLRDAMLHKHEQTSLRYVKFREKTRVKQEVSAAFSAAFTGIRRRNWNHVQA